MIVLNTLEYIFNNIMILSFFIIGLQAIKNHFRIPIKENSDRSKIEKSNETANWKQYEEVIIPISALFLFIIFITLLFLNNHSQWLLIFWFPSLLAFVVSIYRALGIVRQLVQSRDIGKISSREFNAIYFLATIFLLMGIFDMNKKFIEMANSCVNFYVSDMLTAFIYIAIYSVYTFFICTILSKLIVLIIVFLKTFYNLLPYREKLEKFGNYWIYKLDESIPFKSTLSIQWEIIEKWDKNISWIRYVVAPFLFILDIFLFLTKALISLISSSIGFLYVLFRNMV